MTVTAATTFPSMADSPESEPADSLSKTLNEIVVTARQPATRVEGSSLVSVIAGSRLEELGTCLDVLEQLPMISVTDGEVSVTGKGSPEIFIDGRPMRDSDELTRLHADNIKKVELDLAPGAVYSAETGAVLKISTRGRFVDGLSVTERAEVSARRRWSANDLLDINYRVKGWDFFASGSVARNNSLITGRTVNRLVYDGKLTEIGSSQHNTYPSVNGTVKAGFNFTRGNRSAGAYYRFNPERGDYENRGTEWFDSEPPVLRNIERDIRSHSHLVSVYYDDTFSNGCNIHFDGNYRGSETRNNVSTVYPASDYPDVSSKDIVKRTLWAGKLYMTASFLSDKVTFGTQGSYTTSTLDYRMLNPEIGSYIPSSVSDSKQTAASLFVSWIRQFGSLNLRAGLRYDYTDYSFLTNGVKDTDISRKSNLFTPDISLGWYPSKDSQLSLSYRMSTVRPPYSQLTGSLAYVGRHEIEGGNPALRDERMHNVQLLGCWKDFILQADFSRSIDSYAFVKRIFPAPALQLIMQPVNIDVSSLDLYLVWSRSIRCWTPNITAGFHRQWLSLGGRNYDRPIFSYYFENTLSLPWGLTATLNAYGQSEGDIHTNRFGATWFSMSASIGRSFFRKALQVRISATDIFNTANNGWSMETFGISMTKNQRYDHRGVTLAVTYRFQPRKSSYKGSSASESEMNRL